MNEPAGTTAGLQAKVQLRRAWFEAHPNQPMPEGKAEVEALFSAIEKEAGDKAIREFFPIQTARLEAEAAERALAAVREQVEALPAGHWDLVIDGITSTNYTLDRAMVLAILSPATDTGEAGT